MTELPASKLLHSSPGIILLRRCYPHWVCWGKRLERLHCKHQLLDVEEMKISNTIQRCRLVYNDEAWLPWTARSSFATLVIRCHYLYRPLRPLFVSCDANVSCWLVSESVLAWNISTPSQMMACIFTTKMAARRMCHQGKFRTISHLRVVLRTRLRRERVAVSKLRNCYRKLTWKIGCFQLLMITWVKSIIYDSVVSHREC